MKENNGKFMTYAVAVIILSGVLAHINAHTNPNVSLPFMYLCTLAFFAGIFTIFCGFLAFSKTLAENKKATEEASPNETDDVKKQRTDDFLRKLKTSTLLAVIGVLLTIGGSILMNKAREGKGKLPERTEYTTAPDNATEQDQNN